MNTLFKIQPIDESHRFLTNNLKPGDSLSIVYIITLGSRDFSSAVSGFCQVFIVTRAFFSRLRRSWFRPTAEDVSAFGQHRKFPPHARKTSGTQGSILSICDIIFYYFLPSTIRTCVHCVQVAAPLLFSEPSYHLA